MSPLGRWLVAFAFTQVVETPLYVWRGAALRDALLASALTHPVVWFVFPRVVPSYPAMLAAAELFAVLVEAAWLHRRGVRLALVVSLAGNGLSFTLGLASRAAFGLP